MSFSLLSRAGRHTTAFYMVFFMVNGVYMPYWPLWLEDWGLTPAEVGLFTSLGMGVRVGAGLLIPALADRLDARRNTIVGCAIISALLFVAHLGIGSKSVLLLATLATGSMMAGMGPIAEALGVAAARFYDFSYAQARGLGSIGFLSGNLLVGLLITRIGPTIALWWIVVCLLGSALLVGAHPGGRKVRGQIPPRMREIGRLVLNPVFVVFLAAAAMIQASQAVFLTFSTIHWGGLGIGAGRIGALWAVMVGSEIIFMVTIGTWVVRKLGAVGAMTLAALACTVRWSAMMFDPVGWLLWLLQGMHCLTFAAGHLGAMSFISRAIPQRYGAAAQGAMGSMAIGFVMALAMLLASALYPTLGALTYGISVALSVLGLAACWLLARCWRGELLPV